jgi:hypothetical protein
MPRKVATLALSLTEEARAALTALARSRTAPAHHVERSAIILHLADRRDPTEIAAKLRIDRQRHHPLCAPGEGGGTTQGHRRPAAFGTTARDHRGSAHLADRGGLRQSQGPWLSA